MKISILTTAAIFLILFQSCKSQKLGLYVGGNDSDVKYISSSTLKLEEDNKFCLTYSTTSLESTIPSTSFQVIEGKFKRKKNQLILIPLSKSMNWLIYGENPDTLNLKPNGARKSALVVIDTSYGQNQIIEEPQQINFNFANKQNSQYLWNDGNCFVKYKDAEVSNDLKNYCSDIRLKNDTTSNK